ncbi:MAG: hypothetical protein IT376_18260 [Polyangiaceae bacterium]|nr:hypothetical protein [Polyangiaceae bacterium]
MRRLAAVGPIVLAIAGCDRAPGGPAPSASAGATSAAVAPAIPPGEEPAELATEEDFEGEAEKLGPADLDSALDQLEREIGE